MAENTDRMESIAPSPVPPQQPRRPRNIVPLLIIALLVILLASGTIYYAGVYRPNQLHVAATSTAIAAATGTTLAEENAGATVYAQATAQVAATATANQNIYTQATGGTPTLTDTLSTNDNAQWSEFANASGGCSFTGGAYHVVAQVHYFTQCIATATNYRDFALQVQMTIIKGKNAGLVFRAPVNRQNDGAYEVILGIDGSYSVTKIVDDAHGTSQSFIAGGSDIIHGELNQSNIVTVVVRGNALYVYVNKQFIASVNDNSYPSGSIGFMARSDNYSNQATEAVFSNVQVWKL